MLLWLFSGDEGSEVSESSVDTGVDASVIPRPDERDYQREILQLDDDSLQNLRDSLAKSVPSAPVAQPAGALPSLEETRKRPRDLEPGKDFFFFSWEECHIIFKTLCKIVFMQLTPFSILPNALPTELCL